MRKALLYAGLIAVALGAPIGCAHVRPWERETLARPDMTFESTRKEDHFVQHVLESREGASGGFFQPGGGCGCN